MTKLFLQSEDGEPAVFGPRATLTGAETSARDIYVGDEDPAVDFLADLISGDLWIDTGAIAGIGSFPALFVTWQRNAANDGWNVSPLVAKDESGNLAALVFLVAGSITANVLDAEGNVRVSMVLDITSTFPTATLIAYDALGTPMAGFTFGDDGVFQLIATALSIVGLPTVDPADGTLWNNAGVVMVSAG